jgi:hypothetical protein
MNPDSKKFTQAVKDNDHVLVKNLINEGFDPSYNENWALLYSCHKGFVEILKVIINDPRINFFCGGKSNNSYLFFPIKHGRIDVVSILINFIDPSIDDNFALMTAVHHKKYDIVKLLIKDPRVTNQLKQSLLPVSQSIKDKILQILNNDDQAENMDAEDEWTLIELSVSPAPTGTSFAYFYSWLQYFHLA